MTTYYVGIGGSNVNSGLTWALRKLTLNGAEDVPLVAGDTVYVGPGTYRELLTVDVSGTAGNPITYIGDYTGANTDGVGGVVRITGSDNDQTATRANCITATSKNYRTFTGFEFDTTTSFLVSLITACGNWVIDACMFQPFAVTTAHCVSVAGTGTGNTIKNCVMLVGPGAVAILFTHSTVLSDTGHLVQNCLVIGGASGIQIARVGGITVKNCVFFSRQNSGAVQVNTALTVGQTVVVNNCVFHTTSVGVTATIIGEILEDYNCFSGVGTVRTNTATGANSNTYPALFDARWFFQFVTAGAGPNNPFQVVSPFDLASYSQLVNLAGTAPPATDMRGTAVIGAQREWGAVEHDPTLQIDGDRAQASYQMGM